MTITLWWHGSEWLITGEWPENQIMDMDQSEMKKTVVHSTFQAMYDIMKGFSSFSRMTQVIAYCLRFKDKKNSITKKQKDQ